MKAAVRKATTPRRRAASRGNERRLVTQHHPRRRVLSLAAGAVALPAVGVVRPFQRIGNRCSFVGELLAGHAVVPPINGSVDAVGGQAF